MELKDWAKELEIADKEERNWRTNASKVVKKYRDERNRDSEASGKFQFNILYSNVETLRPAFFSQNPQPVVRPRYKGTTDQLAKDVGKILEDALVAMQDDSDYYGFGTATVSDYLLPGRSSCKVEYIPDIREVSKRVELTQSDGEFYRQDSDEPVPYEDIQFDSGNPYIFESTDEVVDETVRFRRWPWEDYRQQHVRNWGDCEWVAYRSFLSKTELKKNFGSKVAEEVPLNHRADGSEDESKNQSDTKCTHAEIWEVYNKPERKCYIGNVGMDDWISDDEDPLKLKGFFPTPKPVLSISTEDSMIPIPEYTIYQDQAQELDAVTNRLARLQNAMKAVGFYAGSQSELMAQIQDADELTLIPVSDWGALSGSGGISSKIDWVPIEQFAKVMISLSQTRDRLVQTIFEITGISDIMRGSTDPRETRGAQALKAQFGSRRLAVRQMQVQIYFRDVLRLAAELIAEHFSKETLSKLTGREVTDEHIQFLRDDGVRNYRIDIETDSTIAPDEEREKQQVVEAIGAMGQFLGTVAPLVQAGQLPAPVASELIKRALRPFRFGQTIEDLLDQAAQAAQQQQQQQGGQSDPEAEAKAQATMAEVQIKQQETQQKMQLDQAEFQAEQKRKDAETEQKIRLNQAEFEREQQRRDLIARARADAAREKARQSGENNGS